MEPETKKEPTIEYKSDDRMNDAEQMAKDILAPMIMKSPKIYLTPLPALVDWFFSDVILPMVVKTVTIGYIPIDDMGVEAVVIMVRDYLRKLEADPEILGVYLLDVPNYFQLFKIQPDILNHQYIVKSRLAVRRKSSEPDRNLPPIR